MDKITTYFERDSVGPGAGKARRSARWTFLFNPRRSLAGYQRIAGLFLLLICACLPSCKVSLAYGTGGIDRLDLGSGAPEIVFGGLEAGAGLVPGERRQKFHGRRSGDAHAQLEDSIRKHLLKAGVIDQHSTALVRSASSGKPLDEFLEQVSKRSEDCAVLVVRPTSLHASGKVPFGIMATEALFVALTPLGGVGLLPWTIVLSLPVRTETFDVRFAARLIDPKTRTVLWSSEHKTAASGKTTGWGYNPAGELAGAAKSTIKKVLDDLARASRQGLPVPPATDVTEPAVAAR